MKSRVCSHPFLIPPRLSDYHKHFQPVAKRIVFSAVKGRVRWQRHWLLGGCLVLIICWTIGSICLISVRQRERRSAELVERLGTLSELFPVKVESNR